MQLAGVGLIICEYAGKPEGHPGSQLNVNHTVLWQRWCENGTFVLVDLANFCARCNFALHPPYLPLEG